MDIKKFKNFLELDWSAFPNILIFTAIYLLSRIPLLNLGFGLDQDAWRIANTAFDLRFTHTYHTSRFPGYPLPEFINSLFINHGWLATNSLTMVLFFISIIFFVQIIKTLNIKNMGLLILTYTFCPILWINSANTMDYTWSLTFIIIAWFLILKRKYVIAGIMMGLALGSRLPNAVLVFPFLYLIFEKSKGTKDRAHFLITAVLTTLLLFFPLFLIYRLRFLLLLPMKMKTNIWIIGYYGIKNFSLLAIIFGLTLFIASFKNLYRTVIQKDKETVFLLLGVISVIILFLIAPYQIEYLIPAIPFGLLLFNKLFKKEFIVLFCFLLLLYAFVSIGSFHHLGKRKIIARLIGDGAIAENIKEKKEQFKFVNYLMTTEVKDHSVVIISSWLPVLSYLDENVSFKQGIKMIGDGNSPQEGVWNFKQDIWYRYLVLPDELKELREKGYNIYCLKEIRDYAKKLHGFDLEDYDCIYLNP